MNLYNKYVLPLLLDRRMRSEELKPFRKETASIVVGTGLEIGFGSGLNLPYYKEVTKLYALDPSAELFERAKENISKATFEIENLHASAESIPLPDNSLDFVVSTWSLCSIPHPETALKEIFRVLKSEGIFSFVEHGRSKSSFIFTLQNLFTPCSKMLAGGCHMNRDIEKLILDAGFEITPSDTSISLTKPLPFMYKGVVVAKK